MANLVPPDQSHLFITDDQDPFKALIPQHIREAQAAYTQRKQVLLNSIQREVDGNIEDARKYSICIEH